MSVCRSSSADTWHLSAYVVYKYPFNLSFKQFFFLIFFHTLMNFNELRVAFVLRASAFELPAIASIFSYSIQDVCHCMHFPQLLYTLICFLLLHLLRYCFALLYVSCE